MEMMSGMMKVMSKQMMDTLVSRVVVRVIRTDVEGMIAKVVCRGLDLDCERRSKL